MEKTRGDEQTFTEGTVAEVLDVVEERLRADQVARTNAEELAKQEALLKLEQEHEARVNLEEKVRREAEERQIKIKRRASKVAREVTIFFEILLFFILLYLSYVISTIGPLNIDPRTNPVGVLKIVGLIVSWILLILQTLSLFNIIPKMFLDRLEPILARWIEKWLTFE
jgi:biopolymer transport protein ExbB/TolQ